MRLAALGAALWRSIPDGSPEGNAVLRGIIGSIPRGQAFLRRAEGMQANRDPEDSFLKRMAWAAWSIFASMKNSPQERINGIWLSGMVACSLAIWKINAREKRASTDSLRHIGDVCAGILVISVAMDPSLRPGLSLPGARNAASALMLSYLTAVWIKSTHNLTNQW